MCDPERERAAQPHGPRRRNLAALRRLALNIARAQPDERSMRGKIKRADGTTTSFFDMVRAAQEVR